MKAFALPVLTSIVLSLGFLWLSAEPDNAPETTDIPTSPQNTGANADPFAPRSDSDSPPPAPRQAQVQVEYIELSHETMTKLLFLRSPKLADATDLRKQVQELVTKNEAKVLETQITVCKSGDKAWGESIHEFMYPTEFTPISMEERFKKAEDQMARSSGMCVNPAMPTAFETRNVGSKLEVEPTIGENDGYIDLRYQSQFLYHTGNTVWHEGKDSDGNPFKISMPDFYVVRMDTPISCVDGQYNFIGCLSPKDSKGEVDMTRKLMVFVKCDILTVK